MREGGRAGGMVEALQGPAKEEEVGLVEVEMEGGEGRFEGEVGGGGGVD